MMGEKRGHAGQPLLDLAESERERRGLNKEGGKAQK